MNELQIMTYSLLVFIAHRICNIANESDRAALKFYKDYLDKLLSEVDE